MKKYSNAVNLRFLWLLTTILVKYSNCTSRHDDVQTSLMVESNSNSSSTPNPFFTRVKDAAARIKHLAFTSMIRLDMYCKNVYEPAEVEKLLSIGKWRRISWRKFIKSLKIYYKFLDTYYENWWEDDSFSGIPHPTCSIHPNAKIPIYDSISEHEFFQAKSIEIPIKRGKRGTRSNKYEYLNKEPLWRMMLECECSRIRTLVSNDVDATDDICIDGKIVNLSRGVGGDGSFFVHGTNSSGSYKVIAHLCFEIENYTEMI